VCIPPFTDYSRVYIFNSCGMASAIFGVVGCGCVRPEDDPKEWAETCSLNRNKNKITKAIIANTRTYMLCFDC
jgi:hypothetical protein